MFVVMVVPLCFVTVGWCGGCSSVFVVVVVVPLCLLFLLLLLYCTMLLFGCGCDWSTLLLQLPDTNGVALSAQSSLLSAEAQKAAPAPHTEGSIDITPAASVRKKKRQPSSKKVHTHTAEEPHLVQKMFYQHTYIFLAWYSSSCRVTEVTGCWLPKWKVCMCNCLMWKNTLAIDLACQHLEHAITSAWSLLTLIHTASQDTALSTAALATNWSLVTMLWLIMSASHEIFSEKLPHNGINFSAVSLRI